MQVVLYSNLFSPRLCTSQPYCKKKKNKQMMSKITQALGYMIDPLISYYRHRTAKIVFIFVGLCVCLSVSNITEKRVNGVPWNFQVELGTRNNLEYFRDVLFNPLNTGIFFNIFVEICLLATLRENEWLDFHENFSKDCTWDKEQVVTFLGCCN